MILEYPGYLKLNPKTHLLPDLEETLNPPLNLCQFSGGCFAAGDLRANEQIVLASMHTLWVHEHNRLAGILKQINQQWNSKRIYQEARKIVIAELQHITYYEYLTKFLGKDALSGMEDKGWWVHVLMYFSCIVPLWIYMDILGLVFI